MSLNTLNDHVHLDDDVEVHPAAGQDGKGAARKTARVRRPARPRSAGAVLLDSDLLNVAIGGEASQSSLSPWSEDGEAGNAVSGAIGGDFAFHTDRDAQPWWQLDLKSTYPIEAIVVHNRLGGWHERARTLRIEISEQSDHWTLIHAGYTHFGARGGGGPPLTLPIGSRLHARYVRVSLLEAEYLHLSQVEVLSRRDLAALSRYAQQHGLAGLNKFTTDFGRPYSLERASDGMDDRIVGLKINLSGRFGNIVLQTTHAIELARRTGLRFVQLAYHELLDITSPVTVEGITILPAGAPLPPDGLFLTGAFFDSTVFAPVLGHLLRCSPDDERVHNEIAQRVLRPHILSGLPLPEEHHPSDEVTIHIRSGDLFQTGKEVERAYRQPPLAFYTLVVTRLRAAGLISRVRLIFEDRANPCIDRLEAWLGEQAIPCRVQSGTLHQDMSALIDAPHLVFGYGTFGYAACRLSREVRTLHYFAPELGGRYGLMETIGQVYAVSDRVGHYIRAMDWGGDNRGEWMNTPEQRYMMLTYPEERLQVEELARPPQTGPAVLDPSDRQI